MAFDNPERYNPDKQAAVQQGVFRAMEISAEIMPLLEKLEEATKDLPFMDIGEDIIPGDDIARRMHTDVKSNVYGLRRAVERAFGDNLVEKSVNPTYLGNMAVRIED